MKKSDFIIKRTDIGQRYGIISHCAKLCNKIGQDQRPESMVFDYLVCQSCSAGGELIKAVVPANKEFVGFGCGHIVSSQQMANLTGLDEFLFPNPSLGTIFHLDPLIVNLPFRRQGVGQAIT